MSWVFLKRDLKSRILKFNISKILNNGNESKFKGQYNPKWNRLAAWVGKREKLQFRQGSTTAMQPVPRFLQSAERKILKGFYPACLLPQPLLSASFPPLGLRKRHLSVWGGEKSCSCNPFLFPKLLLWPVLAHTYRAQIFKLKSRERPGHVT